MERRRPGGAGGDPLLFRHFAALTHLRRQNPVFRYGELSFLLTDDVNRTLAYLMRTPDQGAVVAINRNTTPQTLAVPLDGRLPANVALYDALNRVPQLPPTVYTASDGVLTLSMPAMSALVLLPMPGQDLVAPAAPANLTATARRPPGHARLEPGERRRNLSHLSQPGHRRRLRPGRRDDGNELCRRRPGKRQNLLLRGEGGRRCGQRGRSLE